MNNKNKLSLTEQFQLLEQSGDFLALTLANEVMLDMYYQFIIENKNTKRKTRAVILTTGVILFEPIGGLTTKDIILSSGIHGNETAPIEICAELIQNIIQAKVTINERVLFTFANPPAIQRDKRFIEINLNTLFSGAHLVKDNKEETVCFERKRAQQLEIIVKEFYGNHTNDPEEQKKAPSNISRRLFHYDLHTAIRGSIHQKFAVAPFRGEGNQPCSHSQINFLKQCGVSALLFSMTPTSAFTYYSVDNFDAEAFTIELGKVKPFGQNNEEDFIAVKQSLVALLVNEKANVQAISPNEVILYKVNQVINRRHEKFTLHFPSTIENFTSFDKGSRLASDGHDDYYAKISGEAVIFPNENVALGQRALLTVVRTKLTAVG